MMYNICYACVVMHACFSFGQYVYGCLFKYLPFCVCVCASCVRVSAYIYACLCGWCIDMFFFMVILQFVVTFVLKFKCTSYIQF